MKNKKKLFIIGGSAISNITLSGNMYDDWYIGRK